MRTILMIGVGSFIGGISRYLLGHSIQLRVTGGFPLGTLSVNLIGCFFIGLVYAWAGRSSMSDEWRLFLATGILGGFTTFSAFSYESVLMIKDGQVASAALYIISSLILGFAATFLGIAVAR